MAKFKKKMLKKIPDDLRASVEAEIKMLLHAGRDCLRNKGRDTTKISFDANDGYFGEAFGVLRCLEIMGYGYYGSSNLDALTEQSPNHIRGSSVRNVTSKEQNLMWWSSEIRDQVLKEEGFYGDHRCEWCMEKYGKDTASIIVKEESNGLVEA